MYLGVKNDYKYILNKCVYFFFIGKGQILGHIDYN